MITQATAEAIWSCYREIAVAEKLLADMAEEAKRNHRDPHEPRLRDAFGRRRQLQLGVPSGENCHRLMDVSPMLAESIIRAHIAAKQAELVECNERARVELETPCQP